MTGSPASCLRRPARHLQLEICVARIRRQRRQLRQDFDAGALSAAEFLSRAAGLAADERNALDTAARPTTTADEALAALEDLQAAWADADPKRAAVIRAAYQRIEVLGPRVVRVALTSYAETRGLALLLPEEVSIGASRAKAPPEGFEPPTPALGRRRSIH